MFFVMYEDWKKPLETFYLCMRWCVKGLVIPGSDFPKVIVIQPVLFRTLLERVIFIKTLQIYIFEYLKRLYEKKSVQKSFYYFSWVLLHSHAKYRKKSKTIEQVYLNKNLSNLCSHDKTLQIRIFVVESFHLRCRLTYLRPCFITVPPWLL